MIDYRRDVFKISDLEMAWATGRVPQGQLSYKAIFRSEFTLFQSGNVKFFGAQARCDA